jgi:hypothetical protein
MNCQFTKSFSLLKQRYLVLTGIPYKALWGVGRRHPGRTGELVRQAEGLASDVAIVGVRPCAQDDGTATDHIGIDLAATHLLSHGSRLGHGGGREHD